MKTIHIFNNISLISSQNAKFFEQNLWRKSKHTFCVQQILFENRVVYEITWKKKNFRD